MRSPPAACARLPEVRPTCRPCFVSSPPSRSCRSRLRGDVRAGEFRGPDPPGDDRDHPGLEAPTGQPLSAVPDGAPAPLPSPEVAAYLDMLAAERGAAPTPGRLSARSRRLPRLSTPRRHPARGGRYAQPPGLRGGSGDAGLMASSAARRLSCVRGFHKFLYAEGYAEADPSVAVSGRAGPRPCRRCCRSPRWTLLATAHAAAAATEAGPARRARRMVCLLELLYATACASPSSSPCRAPPAPPGSATCSSRARAAASGSSR